jgi:hypothetical protein
MSKNYDMNQKPLAIYIRFIIDTMNLAHDEFIMKTM